MNASGRFSCLLALLLVSHPAWANGNAFRLGYAAPTGCPPPEAFVRAIETDSPKAHAAGNEEPAVAVDVIVGAEAGGYVGVVRIRQPDGAETTRAVPAESCGEALSALALIAAIAIDPEAVLAAPPATDGSIASFPAPAGTAPPETPPEPAPAPPEPPPPFVPPPETTPAPAWQVAGDGGIGATSGVAPGVAPDFGVGLVLLRPGTRALSLSPWFKLSAQLSESLSEQRAIGTAQFERLGGRFTACPVASRLSMVELRPCVFVELGRLRGRGSQTSNARTVDTTWSAVAPTLRAEIGLPASLAVDAEAGPLFPLVRDSFYFQPGEQSVHTVGTVGFVGSVDLLIRFL